MTDQQQPEIQTWAQRVAAAWRDFTKAAGALFAALTSLNLFG